MKEPFVPEIPLPMPAGNGISGEGMDIKSVLENLNGVISMPNGLGISPWLESSDDDEAELLGMKEIKERVKKYIEENNPTPEELKKETEEIISDVLGGMTLTIEKLLGGFNESSTNNNNTKNLYVFIVREIRDCNPNELTKISTGYYNFVKATRMRLFVFDEKLNHRLKEISEPIPEKVKKLFFSSNDRDELDEKGMESGNFLNNFTTLMHLILGKDYFVNAELLRVSKFVDKFTGFEKSDIDIFSDLEKISEYYDYQLPSMNEILSLDYNERFDKVQEIFDNLISKIMNYKATEQIFEKTFETNELERFDIDMHSVLKLDEYYDIISKTIESVPPKENYKVGLRKQTVIKAVGKIQNAFVSALSANTMFLLTIGPMKLRATQLFEEYYPELLLEDNSDSGYQEY